MRMEVQERRIGEETKWYVAVGLSERFVSVRILEVAYPNF